jgi:hypothetical protein
MYGAVESYAACALDRNSPPDDACPRYEDECPLYVADVTEDVEIKKEPAVIAGPHENMNGGTSMQPELNLHAEKRFIVSDIPLEALKAEFLNENFLENSPDTMYRLDSANGRVYARVADAKKNKLQFYTSVTTIIHRYHPTDPFLMKWIMEQGGEEAYRAYMDEAAHYGTMMHILWGELLLGKEVDISRTGLIIRIMSYLERKGLPDLAPGARNKWITKAKQDSLGFIKWLQDYQVEPIGVEMVLFSKKGYAGAIDCVAHGTWDKKSDERTLALVDFKSGRSAFYSEHPIQLQAYVDMWNEHYPKNKVNRRCNYGCKDYRLPIGKTVTPYRFEDQTDNSHNYKWDIYLKTHKKDTGGVAKPGVMTVIGDGIVTRDTDITTVIVEHDPAAYLAQVVQ